jgi:hypothetical protein
MNFAAFKEFKRGIVANLEDVTSYLATELSASLRELRTGLLKLRFEENFESFQAEVTIPTSSEVAISHNKGFVPSKYIIVSSDEGGLSVCKGDTEWTRNNVYLKNTSATLTASVTVLFLR